MLISFILLLFPLKVDFRVNFVRGTCFIPKLIVIIIIMMMMMGSLLSTITSGLQTYTKRYQTEVPT